MVRTVTHQTLLMHNQCHGTEIDEQGWYEPSQPLRRPLCSSQHTDQE